jgi:hypothetical protein
MKHSIHEESTMSRSFPKRRFPAQAIRRFAMATAAGLLVASAVIAKTPETPAWPEMKAVAASGKAPAAAAGEESYPQYALSVRDHKLVAAIAIGEVSGGLGMLSLRDAAGKTFEGDPGEDTMLLGSALPATNDTLDDIFATQEGSGPPQGSNEELKKQAVRVDYVVSVRPDGQVRNVLVVNEPSRQLGDAVVAKAHGLTFKSFRPKDGEAVRWYAGAVYFIGAGK